jgi:hypothetical protein
MQARDLMVHANERELTRGVTRSGKNEGPTVTYHLASKLSVPSRIDEQVVEVTKLDLAPEYCFCRSGRFGWFLFHKPACVNQSTNQDLHKSAWT